MYVILLICCLMMAAVSETPVRGWHHVADFIQNLHFLKLTRCFSEEMRFLDNCMSFATSRFLSLYRVNARHFLNTSILVYILFVKRFLYNCIIVYNFVLVVMLAVPS